MAAAISNPPPVLVQNLEDFFNAHFAKVAFVVSTVTLLFFASFQLIIGAAIGFAVHHFFDFPVHSNDPIVPLPHTVVAIVGAAAALIGFTPAGAAGGLVFKVIPLVASTAVGSVLYGCMKRFQSHPI